MAVNFNTTGEYQINGVPIGGGGGASGVHAAMVRSGISVTYSATAYLSYSTIGIVNLRLSAVPFLPINSFTTASFYINCTTPQPSGLARILIYSSLNNLPDQKLYESSDLDLSTSGIKTAVTAFDFVAGTKYFICTHTAGAGSVSALSATTMMPISVGGISAPITFFTAQVSWPLGSAPSTFGNVNLVNGNVIFVGITAA